MEIDENRIPRIEGAKEIWEKYFKTPIKTLQNEEHSHYAAFILATMCVEHAYRAIMGKDVKENCIKDALKWVMKMYFDSLAIQKENRNLYAGKFFAFVASELIRENVFNPLKHQGKPVYAVDFSEGEKVVNVENEKDASGKVTVELINDPEITYVFNRTADTELTDYVEDEKGKRWVTHDVKLDSHKVIYNARWWIDAFQKGIEYGYTRTIENVECSISDSEAPHPPAPSPTRREGENY